MCLVILSKTHGTDAVALLLLSLYLKNSRDGSTDAQTSLYMISQKEIINVINWIVCMMIMCDRNITKGELPKLCGDE